METIKLVTEGCDIKTMKAELEEISASQGVSLHYEVIPIRTDSFHLSTEAASIVISGISSLAILFNALLIYLGNKKAGNIVIVGSNGRRLEIPKDTPMEKIDKYVEIAEHLDGIKHIKVTAH